MLQPRAVVSQRSELRQEFIDAKVLRPRNDAPPVPTSSGLPFLAIDDAGRRAAIRAMSKQTRDPGPYSGNEWVSEMYRSLPRVRDVIIDRAPYVQR